MGLRSAGRAIFHGLKKPEKALRNPRGVVGYAVPRSLLSGIELAVTSRYPVGLNLLTQPWDLLIVLDTCRVDALQEVQERIDYEWLQELEIESRQSIAGSTLEWTAQTFREQYRSEVNELDFIAGNMLVEEVLQGNQTPEGIAGAPWSPVNWSTLSAKDFNSFVSAWKHRDARSPGEGHEDRSHPSADMVTDFAIQHGRSTDSSRVAVHYMQPHYPYYAAAAADGRKRLKDWERYPFNSQMFGEVTREKVWETYLTELESVIDSIDRLLSNFEAENVAITADHGEAFGEWLGYGHRGGTFNPYVRQVPWAETSAIDTETYEPDIGVPDTEQENEELLGALGYL